VGWWPGQFEETSKQIKEFSPQCVAIRNEEDVPHLRQLVGRHRVEILCGEKGAIKVATVSEVQVVLAAIVGGAGLMPTFKAVRAGKEIALANKEALVMAGELFVNAAKEKGIAAPVTASTVQFFSVFKGTSATK
jgi:1-deoxy-D-xylulose-5-phosphate reductoisomerase